MSDKLFAQRRRDHLCQQYEKTNTFGLVCLLVPHHLRLVEGRKSGKGLIQHLVIGLITQVADKDAEVVFRPLQKIGINPEDNTFW